MTKTDVRIAKGQSELRVLPGVETVGTKADCGDGTCGCGFPLDKEGACTCGCGRSTAQG